MSWSPGRPIGSGRPRAGGTPRYPRTGGTAFPSGHRNSAQRAGRAGRRESPMCTSCRERACDPRGAASCPTVMPVTPPDDLPGQEPETCSRGRPWAPIPGATTAARRRGAADHHRPVEHAAVRPSEPGAPAGRPGGLSSCRQRHGRLARGPETPARYRATGPRRPSRPALADQPWPRHAAISPLPTEKHVDQRVPAAMAGPAYGRPSRPQRSATTVPPHHQARRGSGLAALGESWRRRRHAAWRSGASHQPPIARPAHLPAAIHLRFSFNNGWASFRASTAGRALFTSLITQVS